MASMAMLNNQRVDAISPMKLIGVYTPKYRGD